MREGEQGKRLDEWGYARPEFRALQWGALRGSNSFVGCDFGVVLGTPNVEPVTIRERARLQSQSPDDLSDLGTLSCCVYRGRTIRRFKYESPVMASAHHQVVHAALIQGVGRFERGSHVPEKGVLVMSAEPMRINAHVRVSTLYEECLDEAGSRAVEAALRMSEPPTEAAIMREAAVGRSVASRALAAFAALGRREARPSLSRGDTSGAAPIRDSAEESPTALRDLWPQIPLYEPVDLPWEEALNVLKKAHGSLRAVAESVPGAPSVSALSRYLSKEIVPVPEVKVALCLAMVELEDSSVIAA